MNIQIDEDIKKRRIEERNLRVMEEAWKTKDIPLEQLLNHAFSFINFCLEIEKLREKKRVNDQFC